MEALGPKPKGKFTAHHDFIWAEKKWFADHGIDVNDAAYGRWANKTDHKTWHQGRANGGEFNAWWRQVEDEIASGVILTKLQIIEKLEECRSIFTQEVTP